MASGGDPWDDSVLVNALNNALSNYKTLHRSTDDVRSNKEEAVDEKEVEVEEEEEEEEEDEGSRDDSVANDSTVATDQQVSNTNVNAINNGNTKGSEDRSSGIDVNGTSNGAQNQGHDSYTTDVLCEEGFKGNSDESIIQYNLLQKQYNDLKEQQEKIVKQMHQMYQGNEMLCHQHQMTNASFLPHDQFSYQSQLAYTHPTTYPEGSGFYPLPFNTRSLPTSHVNQEARGIDKDDTVEKFQIPELQNNLIESETDLSVVIGAWYSAGFYTGRYLAQRSLKKNGQ